MANDLSKEKTWYLGLDIGTSSVGWAVTDEQYNIPRLRGQRAWGVRLFEEAQTAADRRAHRIARRRYYRRAERLKYLRQIFAPYIDPIDPGFFDRMADSFFWAQDKRESTPQHLQRNSLFNDADYTDKDYYRDFPTIFHLRDYLVDTYNSHGGLHPQSNPPQKLDARHYYLACHHIIKYRGHFLFEGDIEIDTAHAADKYGELYDRLQAELLENCGFEFGSLYETGGSDGEEEAQEVPFDKVLLEMISTKGRLNDKKARIRGIRIETDLDEDMREDAQKAAQLIAHYIIGAKVDFATIAECEGKAEIKLGESSTDDKLAELPDKIGQNWQGILEIGKSLYDIGVTRQIIAEHPSLSASFVDLYQRYHDDLDLYNRSEPIDNEKQTHKLAEPRITLDENGKEKQQTKIVKPKLRGYYKGAVPMQLHLAELKKILGSLVDDERYQYLAIANTAFTDDPSNVPDIEKTIKLLTHRVPYYVGPLQKAQGDVGPLPGKQAHTERQKPWVERLPGQQHAKIYPWNFDEVVDKAASAENFIARMVGRCSYLADQACLPKDSVLFQRYMILNELNKLRLDGNPIDVPTKQAIFNELFMARTDIRLSTIKDWFAARGCPGEVAMADAAGTGGAINHKMTSYLKFKAVLGASAEGLLPQIEKAILAITVLPDDRDMLRERIKTIFAAQLEAGSIGEDAIKKMSGFSFTKWGNFSERLLDGIKADVEGNGASLTMIEALWQTNRNFMELASGAGPFAPVIEAYRAQNGVKSTEELIEGSYASVPVKRACRQAIKIVHELEGIMGCGPAKVFIEAPRSHEESKRTDDRKKQLDRIYNGIKDDVKNYLATRQELEGYDNQELKPKAVYLYFLQNGRCAYSGDPLDIGALTETCDIDHIVPQAMIKDDSFDNLALVKKELNRAKSDTYPFNTVEGIDFARMLPIWRSWHKNGLISGKKLHSLSRTMLSMDEIAGFINRQLVETSQTTKMVMDILKLVMPDTEVIYQKAETVAEFKREWASYEGTTVNGRFVPTYDEEGNKKIIKLIKPQFIKVRDMNDLHHAKDAYL
ncbi:MAG: type II CRISPR RNA-guided endonuclease Cas9, partial [Coriobacteriaceae bacterium]|nr:type II CRISPR RNA-guided endonuclease Cas9 [Coriobacteriaceae bacterium]